jgi:hypothetical protein
MKLEALRQAQFAGIDQRKRIEEFLVNSPRTEKESRRH